MKRLICFSVFMIILMIMDTNCTKSNDTPSTPTVPMTISTLTNLNGIWEFQNFYYPGKGNFTTCPATVDKVLLSLSFKDGKCTVTDKCTGSLGDYTASYDPGPKQITLVKTALDQIVFFVKSYNNGILVLYRYFGTSNSQYVATELTIKLKI
jgi:hypothetical protein